MKKLLLTILALLLASTLLSARTYRLHGGKVTTLEDNTVETFGDDMNFCFAFRFSDGHIHLNHSKGIHTVTEYGCAEMSLDNGKTWIHCEAGTTCGINSFEGIDGGKYNYGCWDRAYSKTHVVGVNRYNPETKKMDRVHSATLEMPFATQCFVHRDAIRLPSGKLLMTYYGHKEGEAKCHIGVFETSDEGASWQFTGVMADDPAGETAEGPDEATLFQLRDGRICALYRDEGGGYVKQVFSSDEGKTWTKPEAITLFRGAASPNGRVLSDGTIVVVTGRPNLYLLVDFTGTGANYQKVDIYRGAGSSYASVLETAPNEITITYDESNFGSWKSPTGFSRIHASRYKVEKSDEDTLDDLSAGDPRAKEYDFFYSAASGKLPIGEDLFYGSFFKEKKEGKSDNCYYEMRTIPERPHPVLHLAMHSDETEGATAANLNGQVSVATARKVKFVTEFRMNDAVDKGGIGQFHFFVPAGGNGVDHNGFHGYVGFSLVAVKWMEGGKIHAKNYDLGNSFHSYEYVIDADAGRQELFIDGKPEPVFSAPLNDNARGADYVIVGDGSQSIFGDVDISYIGWKVLK